jgi:hypothetical protein
MRDFLFRNRAKLAKLIDDIWKWEFVEQDLGVARRSRMEALESALREECVCGGLWTSTVSEAFRMNHIDARQLCRDVLQALHDGRSENTPVIVLAGARGGECKSMFFKPFFAVLGAEHVFSRPEPGSFPLVNLPGRKVAFLDEWRFDEDVLSFSTQCLWYDGSRLPINTPKNVAGETQHYDYAGTAPIFATTKLADLRRLEYLAADNPRTGVPRCADASMLWRRLRVYPFTCRTPKPAARFKYCAHCFARFLLNEGSVPDMRPADAVAGAHLIEL